MAIMRALLDRVEPGGVAVFDMCIDRGDTRAQAMRYWMQRYVPGVHALFNRARGRPAAEPLMQMNAYSVDAVEQLAATLGFGPAIVEMVPHGRFTNAQLLMQRETIPAI